MSELVCNYALARFRPYPETGEFVNIGVVLMCTELSYFNHVFQTRHYKRITDFFPELDLENFNAGLAALSGELTRIAVRERRCQPVMSPEQTEASLARFREVVRPRETLFSFGEIRTITAADPSVALTKLFHGYVERFIPERQLL